MKDYYKILGLYPDCPQAEIKKAYRQLALQYHPDKNNGDKKSEDRFKEVAEAYEVLNDEASRNEYDYIKGFRTSFRTGRQNPDGPSSIKYLVHIQAIKTRVLQNGGRVDRQKLYTVVNNFLSDENISYLLRMADLKTNSLITDEILTCCIFLNEAHKEKIYAKLKKLSGNSIIFDEKVAFINQNPPHEVSHLKSKEAPEEHKVPLTTTLIFALFILLFIIFIVRFFVK
jgi:molecular chaperone DnaJ